MPAKPGVRCWCAGCARGEEVYTLKLVWELDVRPGLPKGRLEIIGAEAFPVRHSIHAPAVGYRVSAEGRRFFYLPDVAELPPASNALRGNSLYIGDGATVRRTMVRKNVGHRSAMLPSLRNSTGAKLRAFATPSSPIADRRSWAAMRAASTLWFGGSVESAASSRASPVTASDYAFPRMAARRDAPDAFRCLPT